MAGIRLLNKCLSEPTGAATFRLISGTPPLYHQSSSPLILLPSLTSWECPVSTVHPHRGPVHQWFWTGMILPSRGHLAASGNFLAFTIGAKNVLLASGGQRPGVMISIPSYIGQHPTPEQKIIWPKVPVVRRLRISLDRDISTRSVMGRYPSSGPATSPFQ